jgi:hypothetical protein
MRAWITPCLALALAVPAAAAPTAEEKCEISKNQLAGRYAACRHAAVAAAIKKQVAPDFSKCDAQFDSGWTKAEEKAAKQGATCPDGSAPADVSDLVADQSDSVASILAGTAPPAPVCGNGIREAGEECDLNDIGSATCASEEPGLPGAEGALVCAGDCTLDRTACTSPCLQSHQVLKSSERNVSSNDGDGGVELCDAGAGDDEWVGDAWYRFAGPAGDRMPETAPDAFACGSDAPGWLNGTHPGVGDGAVERTVCFNWEGNTCAWSASVEVLHCGGFYLYHLPEAPNCMLRYCGETPPL